MKLTTEDRKAIKYEKRIGFVFSGMILTLGVIGNLIYLSSNENKIIYPLIFINLAVITICILIPYVANRKYNMDLKNGEKFVKIEKIQRKEKQIDYEAGSGSLYMPILGSLFPKFWGQKMKKIPKTNLIINNARYSVENELFEKVREGDDIKMYYSKYSEILLGIDM